MLISSCASDSVTQVYPTECVKSFHEFAYSGLESSRDGEVEKILPSLPWQIEAAVPIRQIEGYFISSIDTEIIRSIGGYQEIWVTENLFATESGFKNKNIFVVYQLNLQKWKTILADVEDKGLFVKDLFVTNDGSVWGKIVWDTIRGQSDYKKVPVLSKFNESTQRFEFAKGVLEIPWEQDYSTHFPWPEIVLDNNGVFWIFAKNNGIYRYDPVAQRTEKQADLLDLNVTQAALSPDGSIYFEIFSEKIYSKESFFRLSDGMLFQFIPKTKEIVPLNIPDEPWPVFSGMLADSMGRLWLGAISYRESDGEWKRIHPDPQEYFKHAGDIYWTTPTLMLESSDGVLWYRKFLDLDLRVEGTAWYDPQTGEGCMFTNVAANIIEDSDRRLWMVVDGKLYKYLLNP
jgi:hypothetical protein